MGSKHAKPNNHPSMDNMVENTFIITLQSSCSQQDMDDVRIMLTSPPLNGRIECAYYDVIMGFAVYFPDPQVVESQNLQSDHRIEYVEKDQICHISD